MIGIPVLRLSGDYLAIVTLAFGEIIKEIVTCLIVGVDSRGLHVIFNITGNSTIDDLHLLEDGTAIIKGARAPRACRRTRPSSPVPSWLWSHS